MKKKKETNDYLRSLTPSKAKTIKGLFGGEKFVEKLTEELEQDRQILAAQMVLQHEAELIQWKQRLKIKEQYLNKLITENSNVALDRPKKRAKQIDQSNEQSIKPDKNLAKPKANE